MAGIRVKVDPTSVLGWLNDAQERQLPFAVSLALNRVANQAQAAERAHITKAFKLRRESFVLKGVKISKQDRATKTSWRVTLQLAYPNAQPFLDQHEVGGDRTRYGGKRLWQPNPSVFNSRIIGRSNPLHPKNLKLHRDKGGRIVGESRTFLIRTSNKQVLIIQRLGKGDGQAGFTKKSMARLTLDNLGTKGRSLNRKRKAGTRLLYRLVERVRIPARLEFVSTVGKVARDQFPETLRLALDDAMKPRA